MPGNMVKCPFCAEEIQADAAKCRYCGEWLNNGQTRTGSNFWQRGTHDARSVTRGIKQKQADDVGMGCGVVIAIIVSIFAGVAVHWFIGLAVFILLLVVLGKWYWQE
jgi:uncharacterized membrane protein YvbJ